MAKIYLLLTARQALDEALALLGRKVVAYDTAACWIGVRLSDAFVDLACLKRHGIDAEIRTDWIGVRLLDAFADLACLER